MSCVVGAGVEAAPAKSVYYNLFSNCWTKDAEGSALTSNQLSSAVACVFPELAHDGETFNTQIDLLLDFRAVGSRFVLSAVLPQSCGGEYDWKDQIARKPPKVVHVLRQYCGNFLRSGDAHAYRHIFGC
jgi:hypothetical protein